MADNLKIDQALEAIVAENKRNRTQRRRSAPARTSVASSGGIRKSKSTRASVSKPQVSFVKPAVMTTAASSRFVATQDNNEVLITGLPTDVNKDQVKDYFVKLCHKNSKDRKHTSAPVKSVDLASCWDNKMALIRFEKAEMALAAAQGVDGIFIDEKKIRARLLTAPSLFSRDSFKKPSLDERISVPTAPKAQNAPKAQQQQAKAQPKSKSINAAQNKPRSAVPKKDAPRGGRATAGRANARSSNGRNNARPAQKTEEELDAEMADYFQTAPDAAAASGVDTEIV